MRLGTRDAARSWAAAAVSYLVGGRDEVATDLRALSADEIFENYATAKSG